MESLSSLVLPLPQRESLSGHGRSGSALSTTSTSTALRTELNRRDRFLGKSRCVVCGNHDSGSLEHCNLVVDSDTWSDLRDRNWIPEKFNSTPCHEPRNGMLLCKTHRGDFDSFKIFIRFL